MVEWVQVGTNVVVGGAAGAGDQLIQNLDNKRAVGIMSQYGTYYNYGIPILAILATAFGFLKGDLADRLVTVGSQLAGRKATHQITKKQGSVSWMRNRQLEEQRRRQMEGTGARVGLEF